MKGNAGTLEDATYGGFGTVRPRGQVVCPLRILRVSDSVRGEGPSGIFNVQHKVLFSCF